MRAVGMMANVPRLGTVSESLQRPGEAKVGSTVASFPSKCGSVYFLKGMQSTQGVCGGQKKGAVWKLTCENLLCNGFRGLPSLVSLVRLFYYRLSHCLGIFKSKKKAK